MTILKFKDYSLDIPARVYLPSDDTDLMIDVLEEEIVKSNKQIKKAIEIGSGNAFLSLEVYPNVKEITSIDINPIVIDYLLDVKEQYSLDKMKVVYSNLFDSVDEQKKFDLIIFNPPYVPSEEIEYDEDDDEINGYDLAVDGGKDGREIIDRFIEQLSDHLAQDGVCFLLVSSHNDVPSVIKTVEERKLNAEIKGTKKLFFEELFVLKINWK
ncbi:MAG: HemK2/MTQ2 family protein methyltransferase [archaeon]|jgi:HemK-related putative methylase